jgi:hypothetical protein
MILSYKITSIEKLLEHLEDEADFQRESLHNEQYAQGIEYCTKKLIEIIEST